jgi:hypothetical protein
MPKADDAYVGFTCTTYKEGDSYSSPTNSTSSSTTNSSSERPTTPAEMSTSGTGSTASSTGLLLVVRRSEFDSITCNTFCDVLTEL